MNRYERYKEQRWLVIQAVESCKTIEQLTYAFKMVIALEDRWPDTRGIHTKIWESYYVKQEGLLIRRVTNAR